MCDSDMDCSDDEMDYYYDGESEIVISEIVLMINPGREGLYQKIQ
jgi:hypothetical protein